MKHKILILDTSVLCVLLQIPGKDSCSGSINLTNELANHYIASKEKDGWKFVLPVACIIETGNHVSQCVGDRFTIANKLVNMIHAAINAHSPWIIFQDNLDIWHPNNINWLSDWAQHAAGGLSMADRTITLIANDYSRKGFEVDIFTCDSQLKAYQPTQPKMIPRRRQV